MDRINGAAKAIREVCGEAEIGLVLGSGLGGYAETLKDAKVLPYADITSLKVSKTMLGASHTVDIVCGGYLSLVVKGVSLGTDIKDQGVGIPEESVDRIFERFYRVDKGRSRSMGGTGLGLAIAKEIIEEHGGNIYAASTQGEGTTMVIRIGRYFESGGRGDE